MFNKHHNTARIASNGGHTSRVVSLLSLIAVAILFIGTVLPVKALPTQATTSAVLVGAGDIATCTNSYDTATAKLLANIPGTVFADGDEAYPSGTATDFKNCYGPTWGAFKSRTKPVPGNH